MGLATTMSLASDMHPPDLGNNSLRRSPRNYVMNLDSPLLEDEMPQFDRLSPNPPKDGLGDSR